MPNLMLAGAPRCGTTFLFAALGTGGEVFAPPVKEPHFHLADRWPLGGPEAEAFTQPLNAYLNGRRRKVWGGLMTRPQDYAALYAGAGAARWRMEATPNYFAEGRFMAERLAERLGPEARVIVALRDPVARAVSHYRLFRKTGWETLPFAEALAAGPGRVASGWAPTWDYLRYSRIAGPLAEWRAVFGARLMTVTMDALAYTPHETLARICDWLGVPPVAPAGMRQHNVAPADAPPEAEAEAAVAATGRLDLEAEHAALAAERAGEPPLPRVSIGMPVRNGAAGIGAALDSLCAQSYPALDIAVCDNASTDDTAAIVARRAAQDGRIRLCRFEAGVDIQNSYRRALDSRRGRYFLFAPADDSWHPEFIARAVRRMQAEPDLAVCTGAITLVDDAGRESLSKGTAPLRGNAQQRWRRGLVDVADASRLYGLLRGDLLDGVIPATAPEGWDHYTAAKLALRGPVARLDAPAMRRHKTPSAVYKARVRRQEGSALRSLTFARHVVRLCRDDPEMHTGGLAARLALWAYMAKQMSGMARSLGRTLPGGVVLLPLAPLLRLAARGMGALAKAMP